MCVGGGEGMGSSWDEDKWWEYVQFQLYTLNKP